METGDIQAQTKGPRTDNKRQKKYRGVCVHRGETCLGQTEKRKNG